MTITKTESIRLLKLLKQQERDQIPPILMPLWKPKRRKAITGGRGSAKSETAGRITIRQGSNYKLRVLWAREIMVSIKESMWAMLSDLIPFLDYPGWIIKDEYIKNKKTGTYFAFKGFKDIRAAKASKGYYGFDRVIVDEAETMKQESWDILIPTIRKDKSEIWAIYNRYDDIDPVHKEFFMQSDLEKKYQNGYMFLENDSTIAIECNWRDNPWFPKELEKEKNKMMENDYDKYLHIYENHPIAQLEKAIMDRVLVDIAMKSILPADGRQVIGVDVARYGGDKSKAYERRGAKVKKIAEAKHSEPIKFAREIAHKADDQYVMINADNGGLGAGGLIDILRELGFKNVNEINFGGTPKNKKKYANVVTEMYFECKDQLLYSDIPSDPLLKQDLTGRLFGYDKKIRKIIETKDKFKERYHRSPDDGDACVLCFYEPGNKLKVPEKAKRKAMEIVRKKISRNKRRWII